MYFVVFFLFGLFLLLFFLISLQRTIKTELYLKHFLRTLDAKDLLFIFSLPRKCLEITDIMNDDTSDSSENDFVDVVGLNVIRRKQSIFVDHLCAAPKAINDCCFFFLNLSLLLLWLLFIIWKEDDRSWSRHRTVVSVLQAIRYPCPELSRFRCQRACTRRWWPTFRAMVRCM